MLPGLNGFEICGKLRAQGDWTPILVLTAREGDSAETRALAAGADDYVTKPFSFPVLVAHVRALLRRSAGATVPPVQIGDLRLDPALHRCWRGDAEIVLTAREFSVLEYLIRRAGQVIPKFELLDGVWDYDFQGDPNIVEVYIRRLRRKIDEPFDRHDIETVRGAGYRLATERATMTEST
jgi:DNA-binding response OmpR family regulator